MKVNGVAVRSVRNTQLSRPDILVDDWLNWKVGVGGAAPRRLSGKAWKESMQKHSPSMPHDLGEVGCANKIRVCVVVTITGWTQLDRVALECALGNLEGEPGCRLVVVQNHKPAHAETYRWCRERGVRLSLEPNLGFAHANNAGARMATKKHTWLLFTQSDASWDLSTLRRAVALSGACKTKELATVGPSGGNIVEKSNGHVYEWGRSVRHQRKMVIRPVRCHWIAGFWVLVPHDLFRLVGGWCESYFLYYEDPDLCMRLNMAGSPSVVAPTLDVNHARSQTISRVMPAATKLSIQQFSRKRFHQRWRV